MIVSGRSPASAGGGRNGAAPRLRAGAVAAEPYFGSFL